MSREINTDIPPEYLFPHQWVPFCHWLAALKLPKEYDKQIIFAWSRATGVSITHAMMVSYFTLKGTNVP
jgi:hypothetical protein